MSSEFRKSTEALSSLSKPCAIIMTGSDRLPLALQQRPLDHVPQALAAFQCSCPILAAADSCRDLGDVV
jgi:hypothetical protein